MTEDSTALTDQQIIDRLAEFMGWKYGELSGSFSGKTNGTWSEKVVRTQKGVNTIRSTFIKNWNPLTNWNHWRQVEEKVMEDLDLFAKYCDGLLDVDTNQRGAMQYCIEADLPTRCLALISVLLPPHP